MSEFVFNNASILQWLGYYAENTEIDLEKVKLLDITRKNKNLIPTVQANNFVMVFTEAGHNDIFYKMFNAGLGECTVVYNEGSEPTGPIYKKKLYDMINRGINASAAMLIINEDAKSTIRIGINNKLFARGSISYVTPEIRAIIMSKMMIDDHKNICTISGESIAIEAAMLGGEGTVIAVEYSPRDRQTLEESIHQFGINNITIINDLNEETMKELPVPDVTMLVPSPNIEQEMSYLLSLNRQMEFVIYTLDFKDAARMSEVFRDLGIGEPDIIQVSVSKLNGRNYFETLPAPWIITRRPQQ